MANRNATLLIDHREKRPLPIPRFITILDPHALPWETKPVTVELTVARAHLETADYAIQGEERLCLVERKGSIAEVAHNCLNRDARRRFVAELERLRSNCERPYLFLEGSFQEAFRTTPFCTSPHLAVDALQRLTGEYGVGMLVQSTSTELARRGAAEWIARLLLNTATLPRRRVPPQPLATETAT